MISPKIKTSPERSKLMSRVRQSGTKQELLIRRLIYAAGYRFRVNVRDLPGSPDIVNRSFRWAIFVHGCFWHAHEDCRLWKVPKNNRDFWEKKFYDNRERDKRKVKELKKQGYSVLTIWQCEFGDLAKVERKILNFLSKARS